MPLIWNPLLCKPCCAPAARDLGTRLYVKDVLPAVRKPTAKDSVVVSLLLVMYSTNVPFSYAISATFHIFALIHTIYARLELCPTLAVSPI
jgi:hypothetical protein